MENRAFTPLEKTAPKVDEGLKLLSAQGLRRQTSLTGFTYLEVLIAVLILGLVLIPMLSQFYIGFQGTKTSELVTQATDLANDLMEEIKGRRFDENIYPDAPVNIDQLGIDGGEASNNRKTFDDVDDYIAYTDWGSSPLKAIDGTPFPESEFADFRRLVEVEYVTISGSDWVTYTGPDPFTYYKRIKVTVSHPKIADRVLETIVAHY